MNEWRSARLYYYERDRKRLIIDGLDSIVREWKRQDWLKKFYFEPHWLQGPHIRVHFVLSEPERIEQWMERMRQLLRDYPSEGMIDVEQYRVVQQSLAWWEAVRVDQDKLYPDNFVELFDDEPNVQMFGGEEAVQLGRAFLAESYDTTIRLMSAIRNQEVTLYNAGMKLMCCKAYVLDPSLVYSHISYRSHAEAFLAKSQGKYSPFFQREYTKQKQLLHSIIQQTVADLEQGSAEPWLREYFALFERYTGQIREKLSDGSIRLPTSDKARLLYKNIRGHDLPDWGEVTDNSEFHAILMNEQWQNHMKADIDFLTLRVLVNFLYVILLQLGLKPIERYLLCWFLAKSVEELRGIDTIDYLQETSELL
ncbi:lantibiotic dehydratase C-terminal domain-containing protein [Paenibacillus dendritiformis]|uniref:lantibiotic dehydratase C-terminal domain-containing protein n=1 Tax=Paenibacillus dendritiformis TaxID=130049 RepID=UPI0015EBD7FC|nr:lantibiotic dehydratase C-terminal domain-containing protein [Paenibacillus dendritiformis]